MRLIKPYVEVVYFQPDATIAIEKAGRVCYQSTGRSDLNEISSSNFVKRLIFKGHLSVLEHASATVRFVVDRGVSHEIVRHRIASYSQESTRYCKYNDHVAFVIPNWASEIKAGIYSHYSSVNYANVLPADQRTWFNAMLNAEADYSKLISNNISPQNARSVLPNSLKTELIMTANMREWRHFFKLRTDPAAHPDMRAVAGPALRALHYRAPEIFADLLCDC